MNKEIRILLEDKSVVKVSTEEELVEIIQKQKVSSVTIDSDAPYIDIDDAWGNLSFGHSGISFFLFPDGGQGSFDFQLYEKFMFSMMDMYKAGENDDLRVIVGQPYINNDKLLSADPLCVIFEEISTGKKNLPEDFEDDIDEDDCFEDDDY